MEILATHMETLASLLRSSSLELWDFNIYVKINSQSVLHVRSAELAHEPNNEN